MKEILYKFLPIERLTYLEDELLRFTQPGDLNDPFECIPILPAKDKVIELLETVVKETLAKIDKDKIPENFKNNFKNEFTKNFKYEKIAFLNDQPNNFSELYYDNVITQQNNKLGIFSLTRRWNSTLMWSHYTNSHKGFCIGFERNSKFFKIKYSNPIFSIQPIEYSEDRIEVPLERGKQTNLKVLLTKSTDWEYEEEERLIEILENCDKKIESNPYDIHLFKVPHTIISEIIAGANILPEDFEKIQQFCLKYDIKLYKSIISKTKFTVIREIVK